MTLIVYHTRNISGKRYMEKSRLSGAEARKQEYAQLETWADIYVTRQQKKTDPPKSNNTLASLFIGRGRRPQRPCPRFWSGCGKDMRGHTTASFPRRWAVCVPEKYATKDFDDLLMMLDFLSPQKGLFSSACLKKLSENYIDNTMHTS